MKLILRKVGQSNSVRANPIDGLTVRLSLEKTQRPAKTDDVPLIADNLSAQPST